MNINEHRARAEDFAINRRQFLNRFGMGFGALGLAGLLNQEFLSGVARAENGLSPLEPKNPPLPAKAKRVIHIFAQGAPSQVDTWDPKPALQQYAGQALPGINGVAMPSPFKFSKMGQSGIDVSEVFPKIGAHVDEMAIIRSMYTDIPSHEVATVMMNTGSLRLAKSCMAWAVKTRTCRASFRCGRGAVCRRAARRTGRRPSCPVSIRARASTPRP